MNVIGMLENRIYYEAIKYIRAFVYEESEKRVGSADIYWFESVYTPFIKLDNKYEDTGLSPKEYVTTAYDLIGYEGRCLLQKDVGLIIEDMVRGCKCHKGDDN